jgi:hypothetical protein
MNARSFKHGCVAVALLLLVAACSQVPVSTDYDPEWQLQPSASYAWLPPAKRAVTDPLIDNELFARRIQRAVDEQLRLKGLAAGSNDSADLLVNYHISTREKLDVDTFHSSFGYYPCWGGCWGPGWRGYYGPGWGNDITVRQYTAGTLIIDLVDAKTKALVWRGSSERRVPSFKTPEDRDAWVRETITAIFERFPR